MIAMTQGFGRWGDHSVPAAGESVHSSTHEGVLFFIKNTAVLRFPTAVASGTRNRRRGMSNPRPNSFAFQDLPRILWAGPVRSRETTH